MPIPSGYSRNVISGHLPGGEIFQVSLWCNEAPTDEAATQAQATAFAGKISTDMASTGAPKTYMASGGGYDKVTVYSYLDNTGHATYTAEANITGGAGGTSQTMPDQCALVVGLETGSAGRRNRGRIYMPFNGYGMTTGQVASSDVDNIAAWWSNLITHLNSTLGDQHVCVLSQVAQTSKTVNAVTVDSKIDTQRRRETKVIPAYKKTQVVT